MLTILLLTLSLQSAPVQPAQVQHPELSMPAPEWAFIPLPAWDGPSTGTAALMYAVGIDPIEPPEGEEYQGDVYESEEP